MPRDYFSITVISVIRFPSTCTVITWQMILDHVFLNRWHHHTHTWMNRHGNAKVCFTSSYWNNKVSRYWLNHHLILVFIWSFFILMCIKRVQWRSYDLTRPSKENIFLDTGWFFIFVFIIVQEINIFGHYFSAGFFWQTVIQNGDSCALYCQCLMPYISPKTIWLFSHFQYW